MKKLIAVLLALVMLLPVFSGIAAVSAAKSSLSVKVTMNGVGTENLSATLSMDGATGDALISNLKAAMDKAVNSNRYFHLDIKEALMSVAEDDIYLDKAVEPISKAMDAFLASYAAAGGQLDGIKVDLQIMNDPLASPGYWWIRARHMLGETSLVGEENANPYIYDDIVDNPLYLTEIRPMLEDSSFIFNKKPSYGKPEIYGIRPYIPEINDYVGDPIVWNHVMGVRLSQYVIDCVTTPLQKHFPNANVPGTYAVLLESCSADRVIVLPGDVITVTAAAANPGQVFDKWVWGTGSTAVSFADPRSTTTTFVMPEGTVSIRAQFRDSADDPSAVTYPVTINQGAPGFEGGGTYSTGTTVTINAGEREGDTFLGWTSRNGVVIADPTSKITTFTMPSGEVVLRAKWQSTLHGDNGTGEPEGEYVPYAPAPVDPNSQILPNLSEKAPATGSNPSAPAADSSLTTYLIVALAAVVAASVAVVVILAIRRKKMA